ncbi:MAG: hypothetical protein ACYDEJ_09475 [Desulfitobacteriaceae bacterium]
MRILTVAEWHELRGILDNPLTIDDFKLIYGITDVEYEYAEDTTVRLNEYGRTELTFCDDEGDGLKIEINDGKVTHIYSL